MRRPRAAPAAALTAIAVAGCGGHGRPPAPGRTEPPPAALTRPAPAPGRSPLTGRAARAAAVPILMYHVIKAAPPGTPYPQLWVAPRRFAREMTALHRHGYSAVTLRQVLSAWDTGSPLPQRPLVVSFDDGYPSQWRAAFPVLRRLGWPGVLNLEVHDLGPGGILISEVRALLAAGWEVDSHTITHPDLTTLDDAALRRELTGSRRILRRRLGPGTAVLFCYPAGRYDARVERAVRAAGYRAATTTRAAWAGPSDDRFALPRIRVDASETPGAVLAALRAGRR